MSTLLIYHSLLPYIQAGFSIFSLACMVNAHANTIKCTCREVHYKRHEYILTTQHHIRILDVVPKQAELQLYPLICSKFGSLKIITGQFQHSFMMLDYKLAAAGSS